jgi:uncharacterized membrane protein
MYSRIKIFGHPIHPMIVAYPIAMYTATFVAFLIYAFGGDTFWFKVAIVTNVAGVGMAIIAAAPGFLDWALGIPSGTRPKQHGLIHMSLNVAALLLFVISLIIHVGQWNATRPGAGWGIALSLVGVLCTVAAGFYGWTMIQSDHVGVELTAEQARLEPREPGMTQPSAGPAGRTPAGTAQA